MKPRIKTAKDRMNKILGVFFFLFLFLYFTYRGCSSRVEKLKVNEDKDEMMMIIMVRTSTFKSGII